MMFVISWRTFTEDLIEERKRFVEQKKPYWLSLTGGTRFLGEFRFELENYFPDNTTGRQQKKRNG